MLKEDYNRLSKNLQTSNTVRQEIEEEFSKVNKSKELLNQRYQDALKTID